MAAQLSKPIRSLQISKVLLYFAATEENQEHLIQRQDRFENFETKQCKKCREYITELDDKYFGGVILATKPINPSTIPKIEPHDLQLTWINPYY